MQAAGALAPQSNGSLPRWRALFDAAIEFDFSRPIPFALLAIVFVVSRIYWLDHGYGTDPDAWRVAMTGLHLWDTGEYLPSRLPGYPLHEGVTALFVQQGWVWTNMSTVFVSVVCMYLFTLLGRDLGIQHKGVLTLGFAFAPLPWINSAATMDYMWALTFMLGAYFALIRRSPVMAGICVGLAAGFRFNSLIILLPMWLLLWRSSRTSEIRPFTVTAGAVTLGVYTPVLMEYGIQFMNFYDASVPLENVARQMAKEGLGLIGSIGLLLALATALPRLRQLPRDIARDPHVLMWVAVVLVFLFSYLRLPHEIAYLMPLFPFGFFLMSKYVPRGPLVAALALIVMAGFVDITSPGDDEDGLGRETFTKATIGRGLLLSDVDTMDNQMDFANEIRTLTQGEDYRDNPSVYMLGFIYPEFVVLNWDDLDAGILEPEPGHPRKDFTAISQLSDKGQAVDGVQTFVWLLEYDDFRIFNERGGEMYYTHDAAKSTYELYGYRPAYFLEDVGEGELPLSRESPSSVGGTDER
jgi:hypothetical protein